LVQEKCYHAAAQRQKQLADLERRQPRLQEEPNPCSPRSPSCRKLTNSTSRSQTRREQIRKWSLDLAQLEQRATQHQEKVSRLDTMIAAHMCA
jgi:hypothetical protein